MNRINPNNQSVISKRKAKIENQVVSGKNHSLQSMPSGLMERLQDLNPVLGIEVKYQLSDAWLILCRDQLVLVRNRMQEWMIQGRYDYEDMSEPSLQGFLLLVSHSTGTKRFELKNTDSAENFVIMLERCIPKELVKNELQEVPNQIKVDSEVRNSSRISMFVLIAIAISFVLIKFVFL